MHCAVLEFWMLVLGFGAVHSLRRHEWHWWASDALLEVFKKSRNSSFLLLKFGYNIPTFPSKLLFFSQKLCCLFAEPFGMFLLWFSSICDRKLYLWENVWRIFRVEKTCSFHHQWCPQYRCCHFMDFEHHGEAWRVDPIWWERYLTLWLENIFSSTLHFAVLEVILFVCSASLAKYFD